jgi:hypothetical protein
LLKKQAFHWSDEASCAFSALKKALTSAPVLQLPDLQKSFIVECDASGAGFGAVLHQGSGPLAFFSKQFAPRHWRPYLWGQLFTVRTDHFALKFMLGQRLSIPQHHWISKLFGYDFTVEYRPGRLNTVAYALSRRDSEEVHLKMISTPQFQLYDDIRAAISSCPTLSALRNNIVARLKDIVWSVKDDLICKSGKIFIPANSVLLD